MSDWLVWAKGLKGVEATVFRGGDRPAISLDEKKHKIGDPIKLSTEHEKLTLDELVGIYLPPVIAE
jgi:hypothetical protein